MRRCALCAVSDRLLLTEQLLAFLDDLYVICSPERVSHVHRVLQEELWVSAIVWRGDPSLPSSQQRMKILGTPLGHPDYALTRTRSFLRKLCVSDPQAAWLLLLFCAGTRANCLLRAVSPSETVEYAVEHDGATRRCLCRLLESTFLILHGKWRISRSPLGWDCGAVPG